MFSFTAPAEVSSTFSLSVCVCVCVCTQCVQDGIPFFGWCWKRRSGASSVIQWLPRSVGFVAHFGHCTEFRIPQSRENGLASLISPLPPFFFSPTFGPTEPHKTEKTAFFCSSAIVSGLWLYWASRRVASPLTFYICHPFLLRQSRSFSVVSNGAYGRCSSLIKRCGTSRPVQDGRSAHSYGGGLFF